LKELGVKGVLIKAAEQGYITQVACKMPECFCPEELGGACHFVHSAEYSDWNPTHEHFPVPKKDGGHRTVDNAILGAPPLQSPRPLHTGWPFAQEGSREDQESPRGSDPPQQ
jgi:hypothetical protein